MRRQTNADKRFKRSEGGFTIIEIMIVIVIAAVVILIVFLAVPAAQRNARNVRRRKDVGYLLPVVREARINNNNAWPNSCHNARTTCFLYNQPLSYYNNNKSTTTRTVSYAKLIENWNTSGLEQLKPNDADVYSDDFGSWQNTEIVQIRTWTKCGESGLFTGDGATPNDIAAQFVIETGSGGQLQCIEG